MPQEAQALVNVASVPHYSPFRYPGGKTWLIPRARKWLRSLPQTPAEFYEPFAGGASIGLTAAFENLAAHITLVEKDAAVAAVWQTILSEEAQWLAQKILDFSFTLPCIEAELSRSSPTTRERAFQTILRNRINHGGILAPGAGKLKRGENGNGLASRWYPQTLAKRMVKIGQIAHKIRFIHGDGIKVLHENAGRADAVFFIDPPYTAFGKKAGSRLYEHFSLDHPALFRAAGRLRGDFLMTYDNETGVRDLAAREGFAALPAAMKNTHHAAQTELLIRRCWDSTET